MAGAFLALVLLLAAVYCVLWVPLRCTHADNNHLENWEQTLRVLHVLVEDCLFIWRLAAPAQKTSLLAPLDPFKNFKIHPEQRREVDAA